MNDYHCLQKQRYAIGDYILTPIRKGDIQFIKDWRNEQIDVLRQKKQLTEHDQINYYENIIKKTFGEKEPSQILFSFLLKGKCIGYGGLVHIDWKTKSAEVSFLTETLRSRDTKLYSNDFTIFLEIILQLTFNQIKFKQLVSETYDIRPKTIEILKNFGFKQKSRLKEHVLINGTYIDSLIYVYLKSDFKE